MMLPPDLRPVRLHPRCGDEVALRRGRNAPIWNGVVPVTCRDRVQRKADSLAKFEHRGDDHTDGDG